MKLAIMQPYLFPYIGYFQLMNAVDKFVIYDDVNYIKKGWINRNNILVNHKASMFTVPLAGASQNKLIYEIATGDLAGWSKSFLKTVEQNYKRAPYYQNTFVMLKEILSAESQNISALCFDSLKQIADYLELKTSFVQTSRVYNNHELKGQERILDICLKENAGHYINPVGGMELYSKEKFSENGMQLSFIKSQDITYQQFGDEFVPWLSIIDVLMFNSPEDIKVMLHKYELL